MKSSAKLDYIVELIELLHKEIHQMSQSNTDQIAALAAKIATLSADDAAELSAVQALVAAFVAQAATLTDIKAQLAAALANATPIDLTALSASIDLIDTNAKAATQAALDAVTPPVVPPAV